VGDILLGHLAALHAFYGEHHGVRIARKHIGWYSRDLPGGAALRAAVNRVESATEQAKLLRLFLQQLPERFAPENARAA